MEENKKHIIDVRVVIQKLKEKKETFLKVIPTVFVLSCLYIICIPRTYDTTTVLAPELDNPLSGGTLSSIASSFGLDMGEMQSTDAISPMLYPDLMQDNGFVSKFFSIKVKSQDGEIATNYYDYLKHFQKHPWWNAPVNWIRSLFPKPKDTRAGGDGTIDPYYLSRKDDGLMRLIRKDITMNVDKKTGLISINTRAQDPLIAKTLADSVRMHLQQFITDYRTNKARNDLKYYTKLAADAKHDYERARQLYGSYSDRNMDVVLESYRAKQEDLENDMQLKFNTYTAMQTQLQQAKAKVQERTPAFTVIKGADVPVKATGPKRMLFVLGMTLLAFIMVALYATKDLLLTEE